MHNCILLFLDGVLQDNVTFEVAQIRNGLYNSIATLRLTPSLNDVAATYSCVMTSEAMRNKAIASRMMKLNFIGILH